MKRPIALAAGVLLASLWSSSSSAQEVVVPNDRATTVGTGVFLGPLSSAQRTYQLLVDESQLTGLLNKPIVGITWRLPAAATADYPAVDASFASFDVRLSGSVDPSQRSLTFANNVVGTQTLVRSGPLTIPAGSFKVGTAPHPFGVMIGFQNPYTYTGGDLLLELRHTGISTTSSSVDAVTTSTPGYGTLYSAAWSSSATATTGSQGNAVITQFIVPEPGAVTLGLVWASLLVARRR